MPFSGKIIELKPDRNLLDSNFNGYKLSLNELPHINYDITTPVDRLLPNSEQYSLLHAKLFGLHNHLIGETRNDIDYLYFVDKSWNIQKIHIDPYHYEFVDATIVWQIPYSKERKTGSYNVTLKLITEHLVAVSDGAGTIFVLNTGDRSINSKWDSLYSEELLGPQTCFTIQDVVYIKNDKPEIHFLLYCIKQEEVKNSFASLIHWITITEENGVWGQTSLRQLKCDGSIDYIHLERNGKYLYVASEKGCKFIVDSENPISEKPQEERKKNYQWFQDDEKVIIKFQLPEKVMKLSVDLKSDETNIDIKYNGGILLSGKLCNNINNDLTVWSTNDNVLEINLTKGVSSLVWSELVVGDENGEFISITEQIHDQLAHLCSENEDKLPAGTTFNSQEVEDCDFEYDSCITFERLCSISHEVTHKINLGTHQILLTTCVEDHLPPALGIRHDVDVCLWQPCIDNDEFSINHINSLLAIGYIQASKRQKKFIVCPSNVEYTAICESTRHLFLYRQNNIVSSGELKNRKTGTRVGIVAQQQVINIPSEEIIGIYAGKQQLYLLGENFLMAHTI